MRVKHGSMTLKLLRPFTPATKVKLRMQQTRYGTLDKMLVIIPEKKVLYTVIPKSANSTIKRCLWHACGVYLDPEEAHSAVQIYAGPTKRVSELTNSELRNILISNEWFRFTFVRNPYSRLLSAYRDKISAVGNRERQETYLKRLGWKRQRPPTFDEFACAVSEQKEEKMDWHWMPQHRLMMPEIISYSFIGKVERFADDMKPILSKLNVSLRDQEDLLSDRINDSAKSRSDDDRKAKTHVKISSRTVERIRLTYQKDFEAFGYDIDSCRNMFTVD